MHYLYSGISDDFNNNVYDFLNSTEYKITDVALLLQGGAGYENYLNDYIEPFHKNGMFDIEIIVPKKNKNHIDNEEITKIERASAVFIGGGYTQKYVELYCKGEIKRIIKEKYFSGFNIAGLSAGSIIMNNIVRTDNQELVGMSVLQNTSIFPHFEESTNGYEMMKSALMYKNEIAYGIETNAFLEIDVKGNISKKGNGRVFKIKNVENNSVELYELS